MITYRIENTRSAAILGEYEADSPRGALDALARDAGYVDYEEAKRRAFWRAPDDELSVTEIEEIMT